MVDRKRLIYYSPSAAAKRKQSAKKKTNTYSYARVKNSMNIEDLDPKLQALNIIRGYEPAGFFDVDTLKMISRVSVFEQS